MPSSISTLNHPGPASLDACGTLDAAVLVTPGGESAPPCRGRRHARIEPSLLRALSPAMPERSAEDGTMPMRLNAGASHAATCRLSARHDVPLFGCSANPSLSGTGFPGEDIEPERLAIADVVVDHGLHRSRFRPASSTLIDIRAGRVVRRGSCFETPADVLRRRSGVEIDTPAG